jgi:membrane fusion protein, multidrug efflux system
MKPKQVIIGIIVLLCAGLGVYAWFKLHRAASTSDDDAAAQPPTVVSVQVATVKRMTLHQYVTGYGTVAPAPATKDSSAAGANLAAPVAGVVARVNVVADQKVRKGEVLMELNSGAMTFALARQNLERQKKLFAEHNASLKNLQDAEAQLTSLRVIAPIAGTVTRFNVDPGEAVDANTVVATVMDLNRLVVTTDIPASETGSLKPGQKVEVLAQPPVTATLSFVSPAVDTNNDTVAMRAKLPADSGLRPGQFVSLRIVTAVHTNCLAVPEESVVTDITGQSVIAVVNGDEATQTKVQTGFHENNWIEVRAPGLKAGDSVVTVGAYGLPKTTKIQVQP